MTTQLHCRPPFEDPGELIASIPALLRFTPADSVVLITYTGCGRELRLEAVMRLDLPEPGQVPDVVDQLRVIVLNHEATVAELVVLGGTGPPDRAGAPGRELVDELTGVLDAAGVMCGHAVWAPGIGPGVGWRCYADPECRGQIRDPASTVVSAMLTVGGAVTFPSRAELVAQLEPDPPDALARRADLLAGLPATGPVVAADQVSLLRDVVDAIEAEGEAGAAGPDLDDRTIVRLLAALSHADFRESCLALALTGRAGAAEKLWAALARAAPEAARAEPASQLAVCAYLRGEGTRAGMAVDVALRADPAHGLANAIRQIMDVGLPPQKFRSMLAESFVTAYADQAFG